MKKYILFSFAVLLCVLPVSAAKKAPTDYNKLSATGTESEIQSAFKTDRSMFTKTFGDNKETFLMMCLKNDRNYSIINLCILKESDVYAKTKDGRVPLMYAAEFSSDASVVELIVKTDAMTSVRRKKKVLQTDKNGHDSFYYAKKNSNRSAYEKLCEYATDPNKDEVVEAESPVEKDSTFDDIAAVEAELAKEAAELEAMSYKGVVEPVVPAPLEESLALASDVADEVEVQNDVETVPAAGKTEVAVAPVTAAETVAEEITAEPAAEPMINRNPVKQEIETYASTFLLDYAEDPVEKTVEEPVENKIVTVDNPDQADKNGVTLLMKAAKTGNDWDVRTLLASGADVNLRDKDGWTALMYAARYQNNLNILSMLIEKGAYVRVRNKFNATPLLMAADYSKNPEIIALLLKNRTATEDEVFRAFIFAITGNTGSKHVRTAKIKLFLDMNVPINRLWKGQTPLMYAAQYCSSTEVLKQLLDAGADPQIVNEKGKSAFDYAKENKRLAHDDNFWALNGSRK